MKKQEYIMKTRVVKLTNGKYVLEARTFFWGWRGVNRIGMFEGRKAFLGLCRNLFWDGCWCDTIQEARNRRMNLYSYRKGETVDLYRKAY